MLLRDVEQTSNERSELIVLSTEMREIQLETLQGRILAPKCEGRRV